jgi:hypothetical protein
MKDTKDTNLLRIEAEIQDKFKPCKWDWAEEAYSITPAGVIVLPILSKDSFLGFVWPKYCVYDRLGIECSISGDPETPGGVLVILVDMLVPGKRLLVPFDTLEYAEKELPRLIYNFILL